MRRSFLVAFNLTLFMALLVLAAAFYFSYQNQQSLQQRLTDARQERETAVESATRSALELEQVQATRQAVENELATTAADTVLLEGQLVNLHQNVEALNQQIQALTGNDPLQPEVATPDTASSVRSTPLIAISQPMAGQVVPVGERVQVVVAASDQDALASLTISINGQGETVDVEGGDKVYAYILSWTPDSAGTYEIEAVATNINGQDSIVATRSVFVTAVNGIEGTEE